MRDGRARVCIATDVAARGIDLPNLELVIHADLPTNPDTLLHRSGRTGRAGRKGVSALITDPKAPTHILISPRRHIASVGTLDRADAAVAGRLLLAAREIAESENVAESGFRIVTNTGDDAGQSVQHLHMHLLGGRSLKWPPG
jgi:diadenosine tetraphosphate (Ap4A) HIT family hydrolase